MNTGSDKFIIPDSITKEIDRWLSKYPTNQKRSAVVPALLLVQKQNGGWIDPSVMEAVAEYLGLQTIEVFEVATFYDMFNLKPIGKYKISLCTNLSCMLMGSKAIVDCLKKRLGIGLGETTSDGLFTLKEVECMAACGGAPMCQVNDQEYHEQLTPEKMLALIDQLSGV